MKKSRSRKEANPVIECLKQLLLSGEEPIYLGLYTRIKRRPPKTLADIVEVCPVGKNGYTRQRTYPEEWRYRGHGYFVCRARKIFSAEGGDWSDVHGVFLTNVAEGADGDLIMYDEFREVLEIRNSYSLSIRPEILVTQPPVQNRKAGK
jgi:hypothetical protein